MEIPAKLLHARGFRLTPQRLAILRILDQVGKHCTPQQVYEMAFKEIPGITEATVYRTLSFLTAQGLALEAHIGSSQLVYENAEHVHHHLVCRVCQTTCVVEHADLAELFQSLEAKTGFQVDSQHLAFMGLCPDCLKKKQARAA